MLAVGALDRMNVVSRSRGSGRKVAMSSCARTMPGFLFWTPRSAVAARANPTAPVVAVDPKMTPVQKALHVLLMTAASLANGALIGGIFGMISGGWTSRTWSAAWTNAKTNGASWGSLSAAYTGLQTLAKVIRNKDDKYNNVLGACGSGALFSGNAGPQAAIRGCASFALFSYVIDSLLVSSDNRSEEEKFLSGK